MESALLQEKTCFCSSSCYRATQALTLMLSSSGIAMMLLSTMHFEAQKPAMQMTVIAPNQPGKLMGRIMASPGMTALPRNAQAWPLMRQPHATFKLRGMYDLVFEKAIRARALIAYASAGSDVRQQLQDALKAAEECVGECSVEWDNVEELCAAAADKKAPSEAPTLSKEDLDLIKATMEKIKATRETVAKETGTQIGEKTLREIAATAASMKAVGKKVGEERMLQIDKALQTALAAARACTGDECAVLWEEVEELREVQFDSRFGGEFNN
eukprot:gnl/MRDRNA2_/MRDRNA2_34498_c0_seq1.p1 gnl/MRDRNA2_/MRDRNA2_34498_c0~~gnl/MRDRNA2_/MRDRNA2_34498_c0_seq1.p1  ORF type:complete len:271 (+),score=68.67 gnl/MRDRNA2_/MRDRNA2_34498_c0_seq1:70-882(+)